MHDVIGAGGQGLVLRLRHMEWNRDFALKLPQPKALRDQKSRELYLKEAEAWIRLGVHPHIVRCWFVRPIEGLPGLFLDDKVTVLEKMENEFTARLQRNGVPVLLGDLGSPEILEDANISEAKSLIVATDDDLVNVELAVNAKELRPDINIVLKMFDQRLANKLQGAFGIRAAFSATALAAPAFAAASHCDTVLDSIHLGEHLLVTAEIEVGSKSSLLRYNFLKLQREIEMTVLRYEQIGHKPLMHPTNLCNIHAGDKITVICTLPNLEKLHELNKPLSQTNKVA